MAELLFTEVQNAIHRISDKIFGAGLQDGDIKAPEPLRPRVTELEELLEKEKEDFEVAHLGFVLLPFLPKNPKRQ